MKTTKGEEGTSDEGRQTLSEVPIYSDMKIITENAFLKPKHYTKYKFIMLDCSVQVANYFKEKNINIPICQIYDLPLMMKLVYDSLVQYRQEIGNAPRQFEIESVDFGKQLYVSMYSSASTSSIEYKKLTTNIGSNIRKLMNFINDYQPDSKPLIHFEKKRNAKCILTVYPEFLQFAKQHLSKSNDCLRIPVEACVFLNKLRKNSRAYAFFIEKLRYFTYSLLEGTAKATPQKLKGEIQNFSEKRIEELFHYKNAKRYFYFKEIQAKAQKGLDEYGITDEMLISFASLSIHMLNSHGISAWTTYAKGSNMIDTLRQMICDNKELSVLRTFIDQQKSTPKQRAYMESMYVRAEVYRKEIAA